MVDTTTSTIGIGETGPQADRRNTSREGEPRRRRLRDRLEGDEEVRPGPALDQPDLINSFLLCDDDLRQTARALGGIESFLLRVLRLMEKEHLTREEVLAVLAEDLDASVDTLTDNLASLRKSLSNMADRL